MAADRSLPFQERAYENYRAEMDEIENIAELVQEKEPSEIDDYREPLSLDERREIKLLLSWGGPSDGYKIYFDKEMQAVEGYYFFADWFEYEEFKLSDEELDKVLSVYPISPAIQYGVACLPTIRKFALAGGSRQGIRLISGYLSCEVYPRGKRRA